MTQLTLTIEDDSILKLIKKILKAFDGVKITQQTKRRKPGIEEAYEDIRAGRVYHAKNVDEMFAQILGI